MIEHPADIREVERHVAGRLLHMPGSALPRRGHHEMMREWGWPQMASVEASIAVAARTRAERTRTTWELMYARFARTLESRPLVDLAGEAAVDRRWPGVPMAVLMRAVVEPRMQVFEAYIAVASIPEAVWRRSSRQRREHMVADDISPAWATRAVLKRTQRVLNACDPVYPPLDSAQVHRVRDRISRLPPARAVAATRICLNL